MDDLDLGNEDMSIVASASTSYTIIVLLIFCSYYSSSE